MTDPAKALRTLRKEVARVFADHDLELWQIGFFPDAHDRLQFHISGGAAPEEPTPSDDGFDEVIASARAAEHEERTRDSIDDLTRRLREGGGFL